jgi:hypothetical protein
MRHSILAAAIAVFAVALMPAGDTASAEMQQGRVHKVRKAYRLAPDEEVVVVRRYGPLYRYRAFDYYGPIRPADYGPYDPYRPYFYRYPYAAEPFPYGFWWW